MTLPEFPDEHEHAIRPRMTRKTKITIGLVTLLILAIVSVHVAGLVPHQ